MNQNLEVNRQAEIDNAIQSMLWGLSLQIGQSFFITESCDTIHHVLSNLEYMLQMDKEIRLLPDELIMDANIIMESGVRPILRSQSLIEDSVWRLFPKLGGD